MDNCKQNICLFYKLQELRTENIKKKKKNELYLQGIIILIISSFTGALMGIYQEYMFKKYPNTWKECILILYLK